MYSVFRLLYKECDYENILLSQYVHYSQEKCNNRSNIVLHSWDPAKVCLLG